MKKRIILSTVLLVLFIIGIVFYNNYMPYDESKEMFNILNNKHFEYYSYTKENRKEIKELNKYINSIYNEYSDKFNVSIEDKIVVRIYENQEEMMKLLKLKYGKALGIAVYPNEIYMALTPNVSKKDVFRHEFVHILEMQRNNIMNNMAYSWLNEGIADYYGTVDKSKDNSLRVSAMTNNLPELSKVMNNSTTVLDEWGYTVYHSIVGYVISEYGEEKLIDIIDNVGIKSIYEVLNISEDSFKEKWTDYIISTY